jgi:hypothetical protein
VKHNIRGAIPGNIIQYGTLLNNWLSNQLLAVSVGVSFGFGDDPVGVSLQDTFGTGIDNNPPITVSILRYFQMFALPNRPVQLH